MFEQSPVPKDVDMEFESHQPPEIEMWATEQYQKGLGQDREHTTKVPTTRQQLDTYTGEVLDKTVLVDPNRGLRVPVEQDIATEDVWGCAVVFSIDPTYKSLTHLTPDGDLGYKDIQINPNNVFEGSAFAAERIREGLEEEGDEGATIQDTRFVLLANSGNQRAGDKYSQEQLTHDLEKLKDKLVEQGADPTNIKVKFVDLDKTAFMHSHATPDRILAVGNPTTIGEEGKQIVDRNTVASVWIDL